MTYPTWSDLNSESIVPPLGARRAPNLGPVAIMVACEPDFKRIGSDVETPLTQPFFTSTLITPGGEDQGISVVGPFVGAPYAAMILESLIARGVNRVIMVGWCGAVSKDMEVGDLIVPEKAIVDEGTSINYCRLDDKLPCSRPDPELGSRLFNTLLKQEAVFKKAVIWTTDAIYRETPKKVAYFRKLGAKAVEMECAALFSVGMYRKVPVTSLLTVSDSVAATDWAPGFRKKRFKRARKTACNAALSLARELNQHG